MGCCGCGGNGGGAGDGGGELPRVTVDNPVTLMTTEEDIPATIDLSSVGNGSGQRYIQMRADEFVSVTRTESLFGRV